LAPCAVFRPVDRSRCSFRSSRRAAPRTRPVKPQPRIVGGGIGDVNLSLRYDFLVAGQSHIVPGIAALVGLTAPTGRSPNEGKLSH